MNKHARKRTVAIGMLGTKLDEGFADKRWTRWRPTVSLCQQEGLRVDRLELIHDRRFKALAATIASDIATVSAATEVRLHEVAHDDPWDFEQVYSSLLEFTRLYEFMPDDEEYLVHISTGSHVQQICLFLLTESRRIPGKLVQTSPKHSTRNNEGEHRIIDLDLSRYDSIAARFGNEIKDRVKTLKAGIATRNAKFNSLIEEIEHVAAHSADPILLTGPTGSGKSHLARRIFDLKKALHQVKGRLVEVNCATLRGDQAMSTLFGHRKGAFTGAAADRPGLIQSADGGVLFLDEIGELGLDEQAMLLKAIEDKAFLPVGSDRESRSDFQLIAGTNRDLRSCVQQGTFRGDLLARINLWTFRLPALMERKEDIEPNLEYELERVAQRTGRAVRFNVEARRAYLEFATSSEATWAGNFRDLSASIVRLATLSADGRIGERLVASEVARLRADWEHADSSSQDEDASRPIASSECLERVIGAEATARLDLFDRAQLACVLNECARASTLSEAGRRLFARSRSERSSVNDADRTRKYLARFGLSFKDVQQRMRKAGE